MEFKCNLKDKNDLLQLALIGILIALLLAFVQTFSYLAGINDERHSASQCLGFRQVKTMQGGMIYVANPNLLTCRLFLDDTNAWKQCIGTGKK